MMLPRRIRRGSSRWVGCKKDEPCTIPFTLSVDLGNKALFWAMRVFTQVLTRTVTVADVLPEVGILLGFALCLFVLGVWRFPK